MINCTKIALKSQLVYTPILKFQLRRNNNCIESGNKNRLCKRALNSFQFGFIWAFSFQFGFIWAFSFQFGFIAYENEEGKNLFFHMSEVEGEVELQVSEQWAQFIHHS